MAEKTTGSSPFWAPHVHADRRPALLARGRIVAALRGWFGCQDFVEVETGALQPDGLRVITKGLEAGERVLVGGLPQVRPNQLIEPELVSYPTFDGRQIPAWLYRPRGVWARRQAPAVLSLHGGPEAQERVEFRAFYQYLLSRGIGILAYGVGVSPLVTLSISWESTPAVKTLL